MNLAARIARIERRRPPASRRQQHPPAETILDTPEEIEAATRLRAYRASLPEPPPAILELPPALAADVALLRRERYP